MKIKMISFEETECYWAYNSAIRFCLKEKSSELNVSLGEKKLFQTSYTEKMPAMTLSTILVIESAKHSDLNMLTKDKFKYLQLSWD